MLIDTADEINKRPMAMRRGFRSGLAKAIILRKEEIFEGGLEKSLEGSNRNKKEVLKLRFGDTGEVDDEDGGLTVDVVCVELSLRVNAEPAHGCACL